MNYPTNWNDALNIAESLKRDVSKKFDVYNVSPSNWWNQYYTFCFRMCRYTNKAKFTDYITCLYGLEFIEVEYNHITMFDEYVFRLKP